MKTLNCLGQYIFGQRHMLLVCAICFAGMGCSYATAQPDGIGEDVKQLEAQAKRGVGSEKFLAEMAPKRLDAWKKACEEKRPEALWLVGMCYEFGIVEQEDLEKAAALYEKAAAQDFALAQVSLGWMCIEGRVKGQDRARAIVLFKSAADAGHYAGLNSLATAYRDGLGGLTRDDEKAAGLYQKAADLGYGMAQHNLALMYQHSRGVTKNEQKAVALYTLAAAQGLAKSQVNLGLIYEYGAEDVPRDDVKAVALYRQAADQGDAAGQFSLCLMYLQGRGGLERDFDEALRLCRLAAASGYKPAVQMLQEIGAH